MKEFREELLNILDKEDFKVNELLANYTYTKTGGAADFFVSPKSYEEVEAIYSLCKEYSMPITILGNASNIIVSDKGIEGVAISLLGLNKISLDGNIIRAQAGAKLIDVSRFALQNKLTGLEFACGIPGSIGGAIYMNAGAYGGEVKDVVREVLVIDNDGKLKLLDKEQLEMEYRSSIVSKKGFVTLEASFELSEGSYDNIKEIMLDLTEKRESKQPLEYPSCGSVFKRPEGYFAGKLIQDAELQGYRIGGVEVSKKHSGFMVNVDNGTATDYVTLIDYVKKEVKKKFGVDLETEVRVIGR